MAGRCLDEIDDAGLLVWDLKENLVYADRAVAKLYGLDERDTSRGLPVEDYLARVHADDRGTLAKALSEAIVGDCQQHGIYRVDSGGECYSYVVGFGRTFRDRSGRPALYSGIVVPACLPE